MSYGAAINVRVARIDQESSRVKRFTLVPVTGERLPPFSAGAHITTFTEFNESVFERNYSICNSPLTTNVYEIAVCRADHSLGGSRGWHDDIHVGDIVRTSPPKNHFPLSQQARHHVFLAAGIGITPFLSMMAYLRAHGQSFELHYAARSRLDCAFREFISHQYLGSHFYFSETGTRLTSNVLSDAKVGTHVYLCGPCTFIEEFSNGAEVNGFPKSNIHIERFIAPTLENPRPFRVSLLQSRKELTVGPEETLLTVLLRSGFKVRYACRAGGCGTCEVGVAEGEVEHRDFYLSDQEKASNKSIISCVSRAVGDHLSLDI